MFRPNLMPRLNVEFSPADKRYALDNAENKAIVEDARKLIAETYGFEKSKLYFTNTGRTALYLFLKASGLKPGAAVGVQLFTCTVVFEAIKQAGFKPYFLEIDPDTYTLDPEALAKEADNFEALIAIHTFGNPCDMDKIKKIMGPKPVIEDCAQAVYSKYKDIFTGSYADASFFSYGAGKNLSAGGGGLLVLNDRERYGSKLEKLMKGLPAPGPGSSQRYTAHNSKKARFYKKPWYGLFAYDLAKKADTRLDFQGKSAFDLEGYMNANVAVISKRYQELQDIVKRQRQNTETVENGLRDSEIKRIKAGPKSEPLYYLYPLRFGSEDARERGWSTLRKAGIDAMKYYWDTPEIATEQYGYRKSCTNSENLLRTLLVLPTYYNYNSKQFSGLSE